MKFYGPRKKTESGKCFKAALLTTVILFLALASAFFGPSCGCAPIRTRQEEVSLGVNVDRNAGIGGEERDKLVSADLEEEKAERVRYFRENAEKLAAAIHQRINEVRRKYGLADLKWDPRLQEIALAHSRDMAERNYFDHVSPEGEDFKDRYRESGYYLTTRVGDTEYVGGENLFLGNVVHSYTYDKNTREVLSYSYFTLESLADAAVQGWMDSPGHRENILTPFSREGIGVWVDEDGEVYITQNFS